MPKLPILSGTEVVSALVRLGFEQTRQLSKATGQVGRFQVAHKPGGARRAAGSVEDRPLAVPPSRAILPCGQLLPLFVPEGPYALAAVVRE